MAYRVKAYTLKEEITENGTSYFIGFKDGQGDYHELEVSPAFYAEFRRLELNNRKLENWDWRHREFNEVWDETLNKRARKLPKSVEELMIEVERSELLQQAITNLPEIQRRRFLLHYEYDYKLCEIGRMEHCAASSVGKSVSLAREKIKTQMKQYLCA